MRIQHNIMAMNAYRNYNTNTSALSKNLEKLSSGYKINRAGDDAAGLAISEKMRAQITGLNAAQKNVKDGISLVKTAEGAMQEVQDMLNRMDYLATQSANGTYQDEVDRENLNKEVTALKTEINRIADSANFNGIKLLDGSLSKAGNVTANKEAAAAAAAATAQNAANASAAAAANAAASAAAASANEPTLVNSADRLLGSDIGSNDNAWAVAGSKNIYDTDKSIGQKAKFEIDLNNLKWDVDTSTATVGGTAANVAMTEFSVTIGSGSKALTLNITASTASNAVYAVTKNGAGTQAVIASADIAKINASNIAKDLLNAAAGAKNATTAEVELNGQKWNMTVASGVLKFEQVAPATTPDGARADFNVKVVQSTDGAANNGTVTLNGTTSIQAGTQVTQKGNPDMDGMRANTVFEMKASDITDGTTLKVGDKTITLAVGSKTTQNVNASNVVDLREFANDGAIATSAMNKIMNKISAALGTSVTHTIGSGTNAITTKLEVGVGSDSHSIRIQRVDATGANASAANNTSVYKTKEDLAGIFELTVAKTTTATATTVTASTVDVPASTAPGKPLTLQIGDTSDDFNQMQVEIGDMHVNAMGKFKTEGTGTAATQVLETSIEDIDIRTQSGAQAAIDVIKGAINYVSGIRGDLGAIQNRLEHTANNLSVMAENIQDAESTIRDTDVAEEMMSYVKNNILVQSAQAMLAQANQVPQGVLQLLG